MSRSRLIFITTGADLRHVEPSCLFNQEAALVLQRTNRLAPVFCHLRAQHKTPSTTPKNIQPSHRRGIPGCIKNSRTLHLAKAGWSLTAGADQGMLEKTGPLGPSTDVLPSRSPTPERDNNANASPASMGRRDSSESAHAKRHDDLELAQTKSIAESMSFFRECLFVTLLCAAQFVTQVGLVGTLTIIHIIGSDLGITDAGILSWLIAGYSLTVGTFILLSGRCGDLFGYKNMIIIGYV